MEAIKAIQTTFRGIKYRSRLEARWAVFFTSLGWSFQYEPEGYVFADRTKYLPDFKIEMFGVHVEIKPKLDDDRLAATKLLNFALHGPTPILLIAGVPGSATMMLFCQHAAEMYLRRNKDDERCYSTQNMLEKMGEFVVVEFGYGANGGWQLQSRDDVEHCKAAVAYAADIAKSARFEHGENS